METHKSCLKPRSHALIAGAAVSATTTTPDADFAVAHHLPPAAVAATNVPASATAAETALATTSSPNRSKKRTEHKQKKVSWRREVMSPSQLDLPDPAHVLASRTTFLPKLWCVCRWTQMTIILFAMNALPDQLVNMMTALQIIILSVFDNILTRHVRYVQS